MLDTHKVEAFKNIAKLKEFLIKIMLSSDWQDDYEGYKWYPKYKQHMSYAMLTHRIGYIKYAERYGKRYDLSKGNYGKMYDLSIRGKKWLEKQQKGGNNGHKHSASR